MKIKRLFIAALLFFFSSAGLAYGTAIDESNEKKKVDAAVDEKVDAKSGSLLTEEQMILMNEKIRKLEEIVERQQRMIESLQPNRAAEPKQAIEVDPLAAEASNVVPTASPAPTQTFSEEQAKRLDSLFKAFGQFSLTGDVRVRYDGQFNQGFDSVLDAPDRNRLRLRARLQIAGSFHNNFDWAIRLSSGRFTTPIAANQDATDFFERKPFALDRFFIRYNTKTEPFGLVIQAGKFDFPWKRTMLTFDDTVQPEGAAETVYYKGKNFVKELKAVAFQCVFNEVTAGKDSVLYGGQLLGTVGKGGWSFTGSATFLNFNQADSIARALNKPNTQVGGGFEFGSTNRLRTDAAGNIIGFVANYNILDVIGEATYTGFGKYPITVLFNYARNMSEKLDSLGERNAYWAEFKVGRLKERGDIEVFYTFARTQQDAVLSVFNFVDFLATNSRNNKITFGYVINGNVFIQISGIFSQRFNSIAGRDNRTSKRFLFDVNYRF